MSYQDHADLHAVPALISKAPAEAKAFAGAVRAGASISHGLLALRLFEGHG